jgi:hypothetical protein
MCKALEVLTEEEAVQMKRDVRKLTGWMNTVKGALAILLVFSGVITWSLNKAMEKMDAFGDNLTTISTAFAVFTTEVKPFMTYGARFSPDDFKDKIEIFEVRFEKKIREDFEAFIKKNAPPEEVKAAIAKGVMDHENHKVRIDNLQSENESLMRRVEMLERALVARDLAKPDE